MPSSPTEQGLTVAVTGPTGSIGRSFLRALDRSPLVGRVLGMARRPFDPAKIGLQKLEYRQGDVLERASVEDLVHEADVVVHLAFLIFGSREDTRRVNLEGSRNVFEATFAAEARRLIYTSSVAAYGFHEDNPNPLTEDVPARGSDDHYYSRQKAELERLLENLARHASTDVYMFRPCIVAGPMAVDLLEQISFLQIADRLPQSARTLARRLLRPAIPDPGVTFQLVHEEDVASALTAAVGGGAPAGIYNLAADGELTVADLADALGWYVFPIPRLVVEAATNIVPRLPLLPARASWISALRTPVLMDCTKANKELGWEPRYDAREVLAQTVAAARAKGIVGRR